MDVVIFVLLFTDSLIVPIVHIPTYHFKYQPLLGKRFEYKLDLTTRMTALLSARLTQNNTINILYYIL